MTPNYLDLGLTQSAVIEKGLGDDADCCLGDFAQEKKIQQRKRNWLKCAVLYILFSSIGSEVEELKAATETETYTEIEM